MTVEQLIEKLRSLNPEDEVVIEIDHDDIVALKAERIEQGKITKEYCRRTIVEYSELPNLDEDVRSVVILRA